MLDDLSTLFDDSAHPAAGEPDVRPLRVSIEQYRPANGDHLCSLWTDPATDRRTGRRYLDGAQADEEALAILDASRDAAPSGAEAAPRAGGRIVLYTTDDVHVEGQHFSPERMRRFWMTQSERVRAAGCRHLRAIAEMAWEMRGLPGTTGAPEFESSLNPLFVSLPASVICQYGSTRFAPKTLVSMVLSHPLVVIGETIFANPFYASHDQFVERLETLSADPVDALLEMWTYFLSVQPSLEALARYVCNSVPTLIATDSVLAALHGLPTALALEVARDEVEVADEIRWQRLRAAAQRSRPVGEGPWGAVRIAEADGLSLLTASLDHDRHTVTVTRGGRFSSADQLRFVAMAWDIAAALRSPTLSTPQRPA